LKQLFSVFSIALLCASLGCGPEVKQTPTDPKGAASEGDQDKISAALKKAGITKEIGAINDAGDEWLVTLKLDGLGPNGEPPPGRPIPEKAMVHKQTYDVKKLDTPGAGGSIDSGRKAAGGGLPRELDPTKDLPKKK